MASRLFAKYYRAPDATATDALGPTNFSLLKLPVEIRYMVYENLLVRSSRVYRNPPRTIVPAPSKNIASCGSGMIYNADIPGQKFYEIYERADEHHSIRFPQIPDLDILLANRQIYDEAAPIFYCRNKFLLRVGIHPHLHCKAPSWDTVDDTLGISEGYLKIIRHIRLSVRVFDDTGYDGVNLYWRKPRFKKSYIDVRNSLEKFTDKMHGKHNIRSLTIACEGLAPGICRAVQVVQNVLEPLGGIYGVERAAIEGVTLGFAVKMVNALRMEISVVQKNEETYGTRTRKGPKGTIITHRYRLQPWYQPRYTFLLEELPEIPVELKDQGIVDIKDVVANGIPWDTEILKYQRNLSSGMLRLRWSQYSMCSDFLPKTPKQHQVGASLKRVNGKLVVSRIL
ncbi:MAG: hypothetical protein Q9209_002582 [Squamulea sp. 1 TL-2023]